MNPGDNLQNLIFVTVIMMAMSLGGFTLQLLGYLSSRGKQKREVTMAEEYASKHEVMALKEDVEADLQRVDDDLKLTRKSVDDLKESIARNGDTRKAAIEGKLEGVKDKLSADICKLGEQVAGLKASVDIHTAQLAKEESRLFKLAQKGSKDE